jgi:hypothetical protein
MPKYIANTNITQARASRGPNGRIGDQVVNDIPGQRVNAEREHAETPSLHVGRPNEEGIHDSENPAENHR